MGQERVDNLFAGESWSAVYTAFTNISLKAYDFDTIREALLLYVQETYPDKYNDYIASSEFIAILDIVAYLGHSLSFRLDMNTRENFLDLAERRESVLRLAKNLGYIKTRPINARGYMKITSVTTSQDVTDNEGNSLANTTVNWNDANDVNWYENFITILDASFTKNSKIQDPIANMTAFGIENSLYEINENRIAKSITYPFSANVAGASRRFESVRAEFDGDNVIEAEPIPTKNFTIVNRDDNLGPASDRTGFFIFTKLGELAFENLSYTKRLSNRVQILNDTNISNSDVWIQRLDNENNYVSSVSVVDNDSRETAIYNSLRNGNGDLASVTTNIDNSIQINWPDGIFGNAPFGNYRVWYRKTDNENFTVNGNDVPEASVTIPYIGADGRNYALTVTLTTTRDFSENYAGETFESVRRIAPRAYYSQDRMVNAQDYNIFPLTLGTNVVEKAKAINTSFAGNSRFFEMDDPTGHHSNVSVTGTDGSVYIDDDIITMNLPFNRANGNSDDFIRNVMSEVIKHPSLINLYFYNYMFNVDSVITTPKLNFNVSPTNKKVIEVISTDTESQTVLYPGDHILTVGTEELEETWTTIYGTTVSETGDSIDTFIINDIIPEMSGSISKVVRGYRTRFEDIEIQNIKQEKIEDLSVDSFKIKYIPEPDTNKWAWYVHDDVTEPELIDGEDVFITFTYKAGARQNEAEYVAKFTGKKVVFESEDQVKFFYSNNKFIVDNETNLIERDIILFNYYNTITSGGQAQTTGEDMIVNIGTAPVTNVVDNNGTITFDGVYKNTGAELTNDFVENMNCYNPTSTRHVLVSPVGLEYPVTPTSPSSTTVIGNSPSYTVSYELDNASEIVGTVIDTGENPAVETTNEYVYSINPAVISEEIDSCTSAKSYTTTYNEVQLTDNSFKGKVSTQYFNQAQSSNNFVWIDENHLPTGETLDTAVAPMVGVQTEYFIQNNGGVYTFTFPDMVQDGWTIDNLDGDIRWKQFAYGEANFSSTQSITADNIIIKDPSGTIIDNAHTEFRKNGNDHKIIFWTINPGIGSVLDIFIAGSGDADLTTFTVRVERTVEEVSTIQTAVETYDEIESYIYDEFITNEGYVDYHKVKLYASDTSRDPHGVLQVFVNVDSSNSLSDIGDVSILEFTHIVLETYMVDGKTYERVSDSVIAYDENTNDEIPKTALIRFLIEPTATDLEDGIWQKRVAGVWTTNFDYVDIAPGKIEYDGVKYRVVNGRSYVEDKFMSFRWDHFADEDKRIDPSTSNIVDIYVLSADYVRRVNTWISNGFSEVIPQAPNNYELRKMMESIEPKAMISDHISYIPVKFKYLFGKYAHPENQAVFKVVKKPETAFTDSEIKTAVSAAVNEFFDIDNWDFGETFYYSELASYIHNKLPNHISSVVITPKYETTQFTNLLSISSEPTEIFLSVTTSEDVKIISNIVSDELVGE